MLFRLDCQLASCDTEYSCECRCFGGNFRVDGGNRFLRNFDNNAQDYTVSQSRRLKSCNPLKLKEGRGRERREKVGGGANSEKHYILGGEEKRFPALKVPR
jgi:hypothetical protein